jgi:hypothetical protein
MATKTSNRTVRHQAEEVAKELENPKQIANDMVDYMTTYMKENPGYAALACIGVGFVLGWKLKPW